MSRRQRNSSQSSLEQRVRSLFPVWHAKATELIDTMCCSSYTSSQVYGEASEIDYHMEVNSIVESPEWMLSSCDDDEQECYSSPKDGRYYGKDSQVLQEMPRHYVLSEENEDDAREGFLFCNRAPPPSQTVPTKPAIQHLSPQSPVPSSCTTATTATMSNSSFSTSATETGSVDRSSRLWFQRSPSMESLMLDATATASSATVHQSNLSHKKRLTIGARTLGNIIARKGSNKHIVVDTRSIPPDPIIRSC